MQKKAKVKDKIPSDKIPVWAFRKAHRCVNTIDNRFKFGIKNLDLSIKEALIKDLAQIISDK